MGRREGGGGGGGGGSGGEQRDLENCAYLWKNPGDAPAGYSQKVYLFLGLRYMKG